MWKEVFPQRLLKLRTKRGLKQSELGQIVRLSLSSISDMERGKRATSIDALVQLADFFEVSLDDLTGRADDPNEYIK